MKRISILFISAILSTVVLYAQQITVNNYDGGSVVTELGHGIKVNAQSTLIRSWVVFNDSSCPVHLDRSGLKSIYGDREYNYIPEGNASVRENVTAFDVRFILYDVFGDHIKTLTCGQVKDIPTGAVIELKNLGSWRALEIEISGLLTIVSFVAQVRTSSGIIWKYDAKLINEELSKLKLKATNGILEPMKEK